MSEDLPERWQKCRAFVEALKARNYLSPDGEPYVSDGLILYMYELFQDGVRSAKR